MTREEALTVLRSGVASTYANTSECPECHRVVERVGCYPHFEGCRYIEAQKFVDGGILEKAEKVRR